MDRLERRKRKIHTVYVEEENEGSPPSYSVYVEEENEGSPPSYGVYVEEENEEKNEGSPPSYSVYVEEENEGSPPSYGVYVKEESEGSPPSYSVYVEEENEGSPPSYGVYVEEENEREYVEEENEGSPPSYGVYVEEESEGSPPSYSVYVEEENEGSPPSYGVYVEEENEGSPPSYGGHCITDTTLLPGLCKDVVLGEIISRVPWYDRPILKELNRSWANALTHSFPSYARLRHTRFMADSLVLYRVPLSSRPSHPYETLALWLYNVKDSCVRSLPVPSISESLQRFVKIVCDINEDLIYSFTRLCENGMYSVHVLDIREGNSRWKTLPSLPDIEEKYVWTCSSSSSGTFIIWTRNIFGSSIEPDGFSLWTFNGKNDSEWQCQRVTPSLIQRNLQIFGAEKKPPFYLEMEIHRPRAGGSLCKKNLYRRCEWWDYAADDMGPLDLGSYIFIFLNGDYRCGHEMPSFTVSAYNFYRFTVTDSVWLYKGGKVLEQGEWDRFFQFWGNWIEPNLVNDREVLKILVDGMDLVCQGQRSFLHSLIHAAQKVHSLYIYRPLLGIRF